jgi:hypothetical protein
MTWKITFPVIEKVRNPYSALTTDMEYRTSILLTNPLTGGYTTSYWLTSNISEFITPKINGKNLDGASKTPPDSFNYLEGPLQEFLTDSNGGKLPHMVLTLSKCYSLLIETQTPSRPRNTSYHHYMNLLINYEEHSIQKKVDMSHYDSSRTPHMVKKSRTESSDTNYRLNVIMNNQQIGSTPNQYLMPFMLTISRKQLGIIKTAHSKNVNVDNFYKMNTTFHLEHWTTSKKA